VEIGQFDQKVVIVPINAGDQEIVGMQITVNHLQFRSVKKADSFQ